MDKMKDETFYLDLIDQLDFFYGENLITTAELRKEKTKELQEQDIAAFEEKLDQLRTLVKSHFTEDNLPIPFDLLLPDTWVWDNKKEMYIKILQHSEDGSEKIAYWEFRNNEYYDILYTTYEKNRFYFKEVKNANNPPKN